MPHEIFKLGLSDNSLALRVTFCLGKIRVKFDKSYLKQNWTTENHGAIKVDQLNLWPYDLGADFTIGVCLFWVFKLTNNADSDKYEYGSHDIRFNACLSFLLWSGNEFCKTVIIFCLDSCSLVLCDKKDIFFLAKGLTNGLDDTAIIAEVDCCNNFTETKKYFIYVCIIMEVTAFCMLMV